MQGHEGLDDVTSSSSSIGRRTSTHTVASESDVVDIHLTKENTRSTRILCLDIAHTVEQDAIRHQIDSTRQNHDVPVLRKKTRGNVILACLCTSSMPVADHGERPVSEPAVRSRIKEICSTTTPGTHGRVVLTICTARLLIVVVRLLWRQ